MNSYMVSVVLGSTWVLKNSKNGVSDATDKIKKALSEEQKYTFVFLHKDFIRVKFLLFSEQEVSEEDLKDFLLDNVTGLDSNELSINSNAIYKDQLERLMVMHAEKFNEDAKNLIKENFGINEEEISGKPTDGLICFEPLKQWADEVSKMAEKFGDRLNQTGIFKKLTYLVAINRGNGRSTVLSTMAEILKKYNLIEAKNRVSIAERKLIYTMADSRNVLENPSLSAILEDIAKGFSGIMAIDISEWMDHLDDRRIDALLDAVNSFSADITFVFFVPYVEASVFEKVRLRIDDVIATKTMQFVPPSDEQYFQFFKELLAKNGITVNNEIYPLFAHKITEERNDGRFYSFNTVRKMTNELLYGLIADAAKNDTEIPEQIGIKDIEKMYRVDDAGEISGLDLLNGMIALVEVKNKVREILATLKMQKRMFKDGKEEFKPCYHMMFTGNPGTGKTVVARIIGRIFKEEGLLKIGNFYEVSRKDFVGQYVGHTAPKTMEICRNAYGSVLFIDEAYMLAEKNDSFSKEAVGTLIAEMENNRDKMVVIFAGYEKELEELFDLNPGLRDRVPHIIKFPNYTRDELKEIFYLQLRNKMDYDESFKAAADKYFAEFPEEQMRDKDFSNGRFVRNLVERIISKAALRYDMQNDLSDKYILNESDFKLSVTVNDYKSLSEKKSNIRRIGF